MGSGGAGVRRTGDASPAPQDYWRTVSWQQICAYLLVLVALWSILGRYRGISHDAILYILQSVARLNPDPLAQDVFLRYQSQDQFSAFSRIGALFVDWLGADRAAATLTFSCLVLWFSTAWAISRRLQGPTLALLSVALLLFIPGWYSAKGVFRYAEPFMTARGLAEVLSLAALLALLYSNRVLAFALAMVAMVVHPLMAFPVVLLLTVICLPLTGWRQWATACVTLVIGASVGAVLIGLPDPVLSGQWLDVTRLRSSFLFTDRWAASDWEVPSQILATLLFGAISLRPGDARRLLVGALVVGLAGLLLTAISSWVAEIKVLVQGQAWRWLWPGRFLATALLPLIVLSAWREGAAGRCAAMLLVAAWLLNGPASYREIPPIGASGLLCVFAVLVWISRGRLSASGIPVLSVLASSALILVAGVFVTVMLVAANSTYSTGRDPFWIQRVIDLVTTPGITVCVAGAAWVGIVVEQRRDLMILFTFTAICLLAGAGPESLRRWTATPNDAMHRVEFLRWRDLIPRDAEVLWPGGAQSTWLLLDRKSYLSVSQGAGTVFSEEASIELARRAEVLSPLVAPGKWFLDPDAGKAEFGELTPRIMNQICVDPSLGFVVSREHFESPAAVAEWPGKADFLYLYDCNAYRP